MNEKKERRTTDDILNDVIKASKEYNIVLFIMDLLEPNTNTEIYGSKAIIRMLQDRLHTLYKEAANCIAAEDPFEKMAE